MRVSNNILGRVYLLFGLFVLVGVLIVLRIFVLQLNKSYWVQKEVDEQMFFQRLVADRGNIMAEDGTLLATSLPFFRIALDPTILDTTEVPAWRDSLWNLSILLTNSFDDEEARDTVKYYQRVLDARREGDRHVYLTRQLLSKTELKEVEKWPILNLGRYKGGFTYEKIHNRRYYPFGELARVTLGRMQHDTLGIRGIEAAYNRPLRGEDGYLLAQKIRGGSYMPLDQYGQAASRDGNDVLTYLDINLQDIVSTELARGVQRHRAKWGSAILIETETGEVKAMANYPEDYNYAVAHRLEPGSTFKLFSMLAVLEDTLLERCDTIQTGNGRIKFDDKEITDAVGYGPLTLEQVFAKSSNVGTARIIHSAYSQQPERYLEHLDRLNLNQPSGIQLSGEPRPVFYRPGDPFWTMASLPSMAIGYSVQVTPLQMAAAYNAIANGGLWRQPLLVREVRDNSRVIERTVAPEGKRVCRPEVARALQEMMVEVVENGTARGIRDRSFRLAGKTGTARKTANGRYVRKYIASFGGFFPVGRPRYTLYVTVNEPQGSYYGGSVAAPIFRNIAERVYAFDPTMARPPERRDSRPMGNPAPRVIFASSAREVYRELNVETSHLPPFEGWVRTENARHQINLQVWEPESNVVPDTRGMSARDALTLLENMGLDVKLQGVGRVRSQSLRPGHRIGAGSEIKLFLN